MNVDRNGGSTNTEIIPTVAAARNGTSAGGERLLPPMLIASNLVTAVFTNSANNPYMARRIPPRCIMVVRPRSEALEPDLLRVQQFVLGLINLGSKIGRSTPIGVELLH